MCIEYPCQQHNGGTTLEIRKSIESNKVEILEIHKAAFGEEKGPVIADLVNSLLADRTAMPLLSLVAVENNQIIGHILFTKATITQTKDPVTAHILAPLAVLPEAQKMGHGRNTLYPGEQSQYLRLSGYPAVSDAQLRGHQRFHGLSVDYQDDPQENTHRRSFLPV